MVDPIGDADFGSEPAGHQAGAGRGADRGGGEAAFQIDALLADAVDVGGFELGVAGEAHGPGGLVVGVDEHNVRPIGSGQ